MSANLCRIFCACTALSLSSFALAAPAPATCRRTVMEGEVNAGQQFLEAIGNGLALLLQPIASGWILRIIPASGPRGDHDYAELATPPYHSVTALSISTDFSFRAQDAIGWNPRRFHFATSSESFRELAETVNALPTPPAVPSPAVQQHLAGLLSSLPEGTFRITDARLIPGAANQTLMAGAVAVHFASTAHTVQQPAGPTALGKLLWIRFRISLDLPANFLPSPKSHTEVYPCALP